MELQVWVGRAQAVIERAADRGGAKLGGVGRSRSGSVYVHLADRFGCRVVVRLSDHRCERVSMGAARVFQVLDGRAVELLAVVRFIARKKSCRGNSRVGIIAPEPSRLPGFQS